MSFTSVNTDVHIKRGTSSQVDSEPTTTWSGRVLLSLGAFGSVAFVVLVVIGGAITDGYDHASQAISELGATGAEHATLQALAFIVVGVGACCFAVGLHLAARTPLTVTALVVVFGVLSAFAQAALPCDEGCEPTTATGTGHIVTGSIGFVAALVAMFLIARHWRRSDPFAVLARPTLALAWTALAGLIAFNVTKGAGFEAVDGVAQRVFALCVLSWMVMTALVVRRLAATPSR